MKWNVVVRKGHRLISLLFMAMVIVNIAVQGREELALWVGMATLFPLFVLMLTGLYLFALPHVTRWRKTHAKTHSI